MSSFGCRPAAVVAQPVMGNASRAAAVVHQYGHFRRLDGFRFSQRSPEDAWILAAPTIYAAARSPHGYTSDRPIPQSSSAIKVSEIVIFLKRLEFWRNIKWFNWKCMVYEQSCMSASKLSLVVNSHLRVAGGHPFLAVGGLKEAPPAPIRWHVGGIPVPLRTPCRRTQAIGPTYVLALENSWAAPVKALLLIFTFVVDNHCRFWK
jgi:hypothetical protein